jgi:hypothetical protein
MADQTKRWIGAHHQRNGVEEMVDRLMAGKGKVTEQVSTGAKGSCWQVSIKNMRKNLS